MNHAFSTYHPIINFGFFCAVIGIGVFVIHPVFIAIAVIASFSYAISMGSKSTLKFMGCFLLPMIIIVTIVNPLVNHRGSTVIYQTEYHPITMEAAVYGLVTGLMIATVILWFNCYSKVMTSDKFVYLFGRIIPSTSLIFSMVMRFIPNYRMQIAKISDAQKGIGKDVSSGKVMDRIRHGLRIISIMFTWALENSIESADSMRARGYGLKNRTAFSIYRFDKRDALAAAVIAGCTIIVIAGAALGKCAIEFYPVIVFAQVDATGIIVYAAYALLCFFPSLVQLKEVIWWKRSESKI
ncbi:MAG: energy-coupling factor transporter transmembrane protein EcfT [Eubacterium sp.]|nr:energy-coupling factor transporter transmembrane protein EcfT [Candidatus Colimonas fimequi]